MENRLFRKKVIDRISSPEQLNDYIRVENPGVWLVFLGVLLVLAGILVWSIFGRLDTLLSVGAVTAEGETVCYVKEADAARIGDDMTVRIGGETCTVADIAPRPVQVDDSFPEYLCHVGELAAGEWVYAVTLDAACGEEGSIYSADIVLESIAPLHFLIN